MKGGAQLWLAGVTQGIIVVQIIALKNAASYSDLVHSRVGAGTLGGESGIMPY